MLLPSNYSTNSFASPNNIEQSVAGLMLEVPVSANSDYDYQKNFALVTSLVLCNRSSTNLAVSAKIVNGTTSAFLLSGQNIPPNLSFDVITGNKIILKEGDKLYVWHSSATANSLSAVLSYTLHSPLSTYDI